MNNNEAQNRGKNRSERESIAITTRDLARARTGPKYFGHIDRAGNRSFDFPLSDERRIRDFYEESGRMIDRMFGNEVTF